MNAAFSSFSLRKKIFLVSAATIIFACLLFLSGINFIIYSNGHVDKEVKAAMCSGNPEENEPANPVEKKASGVTNLPEEYFHHHSHFSFYVLKEGPITRGEFSEKLCTVHFDLISPPPDRHLFS